MGLPNIVFIDFKRTERIGLTRTLRDYIQFSYAEHPDAYIDDFRVLDELRSDCLNLEVHYNALNRLLKYYGQLVFIGSKFPIDVGIEFPWSLAFSEDKKLIAHRNFCYEKACVLFNIGAMYSQLGVAENRFSASGVKKASQHFQCAAGCFSYLNEVVVPEMRSVPPLDMTTPVLNCLVNLMLAQAQECFWQKAVNDKLKDGTIAKLAGQVADFYEAAHELSNTDPAIVKLLGQEFITHLQVKSWHFFAGSEFRKSSENISQNQYGDEIARLKVAEGLIKRALTQQRYLRDSVISDLKSLEKPINDNLSRAEKDNDIIYLHTIPSASSLPSIGRAKMVSATLPPEIKDPISMMNEKSLLGEPLFVKLVPFAVHQAISVYSDRKDTLVREEIIGKLQELTSICKSTLQSLKLPGSLEILEQPVGLPSSLIQKSNEIRNAGGFEFLKEKLEILQELESKDTAILEEARLYSLFS
ncbi:3078_t:CDS:2 [Ambispora leptoticha]|uniref:3078_t:CDS:1 n=1 Tax=Ambispora leptoticha TaxID=144679 RepID=A0A9N8W5V0_9GLOM|nr:3078_t:CDS:2 [Ambispora leptoticha]